MEASAVVVLTLCLGTMLSGWWIFQHVRLERPPLGTISLADVGIMIGAVVLVPLLYLALPSFMISGLLLVAAASSVHTLFSALLDSKRAVWSIVGLAMVADVACEGFAEGADEIDIGVEQRPHPLDVVGLPGHEKGGDPSNISTAAQRAPGSL